MWSIADLNSWYSRLTKELSLDFSGSFHLGSTEVIFHSTAIRARLIAASRQVGSKAERTASHAFPNPSLARRETLVDHVQEPLTLGLKVQLGLAAPPPALAEFARQCRMIQEVLDAVG